MSEPAAAAAAADDTPPSGTPTAAASDGLGDMLSLSTPPQAQSQNETKRYTPPKADSQTFDTQQEFLDSLQPMSIDDVDEAQRKCPICWKYFGEPPDFGFDNSELPVKLRCNHIFGHKCLANTYALPQASHIQLQPLSLAPHSKGRLLAKKLAEYFKMHGSNFRNEAETFDKMLQESCQLSRGPEICGTYWWPLFEKVLQAGCQPAQVILMENAMVIDYEPPKRQNQTGQSYAIGSEHLNASSTGLDQSLASLASTYNPSTVMDSGSGSVEVPHGQSSTSAFAPTAIPNSTLPPAMLQHSAAIAAKTQQAFYNSIGMGITGMGITAGTNDAQKTWQTALANKTNLDKLSDLHKEMAATHQKSQEKLAALQKELAHTYNEAQFMLSGELKEQKLEVAEALQTKVAIEIQNLEALRAKAALERKAQALRTLLAKQLASVFAQYRAMPSENPEFTSTDVVPRIVRTSVQVHIHELYKTQHTIAPPMGAPGYSDEEDTDDEDEFDVNGSTMVITRTFCGTCCATLEDMVLDTPERLTWRNHKAIPDGCPLCHCVLFKKSRG